MIKRFTVIDTDGRVLFSGESEEPAETMSAFGEVIPDYMATPEEYWNGTAFVPRPDLDTINEFSNANEWVADDEDIIKYGDALPNPTRVTVLSQHQDFVPVPPFNVTDGKLQLTATIPGSYMILLEAFPYLDKQIIVEALQDPKLT